MGRKIGSTTLHPDWKLQLWLAVQVLCETRVSKTGKKITPHAAAKILAETGGFYGIVGGDCATIAKHDATRSTSLIKMCVVKEKGLLQLKNESSIADKRKIVAKVFVSHRMENFRTLLERYYEIARWLKFDPLTAFAWNNILADRLDRPRVTMPWARGGQARFRIVEERVTLVTD